MEDTPKIYPNPADDQLIVETYSNSPFVVSIYDSVGRLVSRTKQTDSVARINTSLFSAGNYVVEVSNGVGLAIARQIVVIAH